LLIAMNLPFVGGLVRLLLVATLLGLVIGGGMES